MPKFLKALTTITAWILFVNGCIMLLAVYTVEVYYTRVLQSWPIEDVIGLGVAILSFIGAVFAMKARSRME
jgi:L-cystine uptake protein TcyP (sodium:dicarboxylate symporter family)